MVSAVVPIDRFEQDSGERPGEPIPGTGTNATRHLSAGAYLDDEFCLTALRRVYYSPKRIVAPSYGFDLITVLGHCLLARRMMILRDGMLVGLLVFASWVSVSAVPIVLLALLTFHMAAIVVRVIWESIEYLREPKRFGGTPGLDGRITSDRARQAAEWARQNAFRRGFRRLWFENLVAAVVARGFAVALAYIGIALIAMTASVGLWHADLLGGLGSPIVMGWVVLLSVLIPVCARCWSRLRLRTLVPGSPAAPPVKSERLREIASQLGGNTVVYSGHRPFVGGGEIFRRWDLTQRLVRFVAPEVVEQVVGPMTELRREFRTPPFTARAISAYVHADLQRIAADRLAELHLPNLTVAERVFVAGTEISDLRPYTPPDSMSEIIRQPTAPQRHYLVCQVVSWRGELVTTVYVHFAVQGRALYVELYLTGLLPCDGRFRVVDEVGGTGAKAVLRDAMLALRTAPALVAYAPVNLVRCCGDVIRLRSRSRDSRVRKGYDYGARISVREIGASEDVRDHMQAQDVTKYGRIIERRVLAATLDFLEAKGVDITEYRQRSLTILNAGAVATNGGTVNVGGAAVGTQNNGAAPGGPSSGSQNAGA
jgi:hypothetical protein